LDVKRRTVDSKQTSLNEQLGRRSHISHSATHTTGLYTIHTQSDVMAEGEEGPVAHSEFMAVKMSENPRQKIFVQEC